MLLLADSHYDDGKLLTAIMAVSAESAAHSHVHVTSEETGSLVAGCSFVDIGVNRARYYARDHYLNASSLSASVDHTQALPWSL